MTAFHLWASHYPCEDAFGETPKSADEDVRAHQSGPLFLSHCKISKNRRVSAIQYDINILCWEYKY